MSYSPTKGKARHVKKRVHKGHRFELRFHSGYKGKETPRAVLIGSREFKIGRVLERKRVLDEQSGKRSDVFTCEMEGQRVKIVIQDSGVFELIFL
jgi:hypothetical protein